ncbi:hypothetical protein FT663_02010 [Candidozyma haemuli var. vulneris]|uniref:Kinetochore protein Sos7 coiled-coil domain-containing protein n=1 Tax=Candidozyma haemuli TaxID=45357 RepID=A0A2V1APR3_9ASCO|nr:hypothetical protein CXQ85_001243 [[Candida] haemuloni]KAF3991858.1 hypothetical protein FT662_01475 [[Candida] haemuloni var. vulneris]KAF3993179.1 hypothetical protein FT663_02010 [[Candida] haemuloni var. vulneris]PVH18951.1 hypothetical protein CXQ85_001243 [[Candida] haemuloni]
MTDIEQIGKGTSIPQAKEVFENVTNTSNSSLQNPGKIKEELTHLKQFLSKLKFQYLEQETRDKFLRSLLIDEKSISKEDVDKIVGENQQLKQSLKSLKREIEASTEQAENMAEEVVDLNKQLEKRKTEANESLAEVNELQKELDSLMSEGENENYKTLFNFKKLIDSDDIGLSEAISIANSAVENDEATLKEIVAKLETAQAEASDKRAQLERLEQQTKELESQVGEEDAPVEMNEQQEYAQKLGDIKAALSRFVPTKS